MAKKTLIQMLHLEIQHKQKDLMLLEKQLEQLEKSYAALENEIETEKQHIAEQPQHLNDFHLYFTRMEQRKKLLSQNRQGLLNHREAIQEKVSALFGEIKKYEILLAAEQKERHKEAVDSEQKEMDEITTAQFFATNHV